MIFVVYNSYEFSLHARKTFLSAKLFHRKEQIQRLPDQVTSTERGTVSPCSGGLTQLPVNPRLPTFLIT